MIAKHPSPAPGRASLGGREDRLAGRVVDEVLLERAERQAQPQRQLAARAETRRARAFCPTPRSDKPSLARRPRLTIGRRLSYHIAMVLDFRPGLRASCSLPDGRDATAEDPASIKELPRQAATSFDALVPALGFRVKYFCDYLSLRAIAHLR